MKRTLSIFGYLAAILLGVAFTGIVLGVTEKTNAQTTTLDDSLTIEETAEDKENILWLARIAYSETKKPVEMIYVSWVARNRVEAQYKGSTYKEVALSPKQFSGLNAFDANYKHNITRNYDSDGEAWRNALIIARAVYYADSSFNPFEQDVFHFYSPISMKGGKTPSWAVGKKAVHMIEDENTAAVRFAFYGGVN